MQTKPTGWPTDSSVEVMPEVFLVTKGAWPPAQDGLPAGTAAAGSWSVDRSLTGSPLPGQVRGASGFSIATGSVSFAQPDGAQVVPWSKDRSRRLSVGGKCQLVASHGKPETGLQLGAFVVAPSSGNSISNQVVVDLEEDSIRLKRRFTLGWEFNQDHDFYAARVQSGASAFELEASWIIDQVARAGGYYQTPPPPSDCVVSLPLVGGTMADRGSTKGAGVSSWVEQGELVGLGPDSYVSVFGDEPIPSSCWVSAQVSGTGGRIFLGAVVILDIRSNRVDLRSASTVYATMPFTPTSATPTVIVGVSRPGARQVRLDVTVDGEAVGAVTGAFAEGDWASWASTLTVDTRSSNGGGSSANRFIRSVRVTKTYPSALASWVPTATIHLTGSPLHGVFTELDTDAWAVVQEIAAATMGAVWISEDGIFTYRSRSRLRGMDGTLTSIEAMDRLEELPWSLDPSDVADRVELTYTPASVEYSTHGALTLWEATETIMVNAGKSVDVIADLSGTTSRLADFLPVWSEDVAEGNYSRWAAATSASGSGERPADTAITVAPRFLSPSQIRLRVTNHSEETLWLVDGNGNPCLILRSYLHISPDEPVTLALGVAAEEAAAPLEINAGPWIQDSDAAQAMLSWASGQTGHAQATVDRVRVKPDLGYQLGDVHLLTDGITGLRAKVLITGISLSGDKSGYTQHLDLALLDLTWEDLDQWLERHGIDTFSALDDFMSATSLDTFEAFDQWGQDFGGTL